MDTDKRFAHISNDPKFRKIPKDERKVKIDKRFESMFTDKKFKVKYTVDKRGRPVNHSTTEDLKRYYELSSEEDNASSDSDSEDNNTITPKSKVPLKESETEESSTTVLKDTEQTEESSSVVLKETRKGDKKVPDAIKKKLKNINIDYARGESRLLSESSSDEEESDDYQSDNEGIDHKWGELDNDAESTEEATTRLAACNMDWDRIRATDLMVLFNSFLNTGGLIKSIVIYPSEFGKKRMEEEEVRGPSELVQAKKNTNKEESEDHVEGSKFHMEKLRQYQLNRLKYYYAVITCDSIETAGKIYAECDGIEYESSSTKIDLRFIPEDMSFEDDPKESCDSLPDLAKYKPRFFTTTALQQAKVDLTWDETNPERLEVTQKLAEGKIDDITEADLQDYLAGSSSEEEEDEKEDSNSDAEENVNPIDKYKALLQQIEIKEEEKKNKDVEMEISWGVDLKEKTDKLIKKKITASENKTPFEQFLDKRKEKRKAKREEKRKTGDDDESSDSDVDIPSDIDMNDPYFAEEFNKPEFQKKKNKKPKKPEQGDSEDEKKQKAELELLLGEDDDKKHFSLKKIQDNENETKSKKKMKRKNNNEEEKTGDDDFEIDVGDARFSALFTSHHYNIDPTDPHYKKTKAMDKLITEKIKRRDANEVDDGLEELTPKEKIGKKSAELSVLVKSVKRKAGAFGSKKIKKVV